MHISFRCRTYRLFSIVRQIDLAFANKPNTLIHPKSLLKTPSHCFYHTQKNIKIAQPLRSTKPKARASASQYFDDIKLVRAIGGTGGHGTISFLQVFANDRAGPDGGDGGNGAHVVFKATRNITDLHLVSKFYKADNGENGQNKNMFGKSAEHTIINVPLGTLVRSTDGKILADLNKENMMFVAARGGAGGHGNSFFKSDLHVTPKVAEYGANGEDIQYILEISQMAHIGMIGFPNAGKSTLLRAISRARPKVAPYAFTTLKPHIGMILYDDHEQVAVADLPGLIEDSHKNKGLGIQFLKHVERCSVLLFVIDVSLDEPWQYFDILKHELRQFNDNLNKRPFVVVANKIDLPRAKENLEILRQKINFPILPISARTGENVTNLLREIRLMYDQLNVKLSSENEDENGMHG